MVPSHICRNLTVSGCRTNSCTGASWNPGPEVIRRLVCWTSLCGMLLVASGRQWRWSEVRQVFDSTIDSDERLPENHGSFCGLECWEALLLQSSRFDSVLLAINHLRHASLQGGSAAASA
eukprot:1251348-Amphidinium_carterae.1